MTIDMTQFGGKPVMLGSVEVWDFGYRGPGFGTTEEQNREIDWLDTIPDFQPSGIDLFADEDRVNFAHLWKHPDTVAALGRPYECARQFTGSCVGCGGGNLLMTTICLEAIVKKEPEKIFIPFWPLVYGRSRFHGGMRGRGDGSFEGAWMEAATQDGVIPATMEGLPPIRWGDGMEYSGSIEMDWSDGGRIADKWLQESRKHLLKGQYRIRNADDGWKALGEMKLIGWCGMWGGLMECPLTGNPQVRLNRRRGSWAHKQTCLGRWQHPELGRLFKIYNQWGLRTHGDDAQGDPGGGYWIKEEEFEWQARQGECIAYDLFDGIPAPAPEVIDWLNAA
jgi:hypothetical protein